MRDVHIIVTEKDGKLMINFPRDLIAFKECEDIGDFGLDMTAYSDEFRHEDTIGMVNAEVKMFKSGTYLELHVPERVFFPHMSINGNTGGHEQGEELLLSHRIAFIENSPKFDKDNS